ncbi:unnamed protein product [Prorocentrum cordatum]|uniref:Uncharacterized protein n=1 Tax=Prorocentrum cordatum TaxID=2364126 RepID=A0ABN9XJP5_9DINO|nr:unnamed protein product [Polarella glacialis]
MVGENGTNVPLAMMWVAGRLTGMQSNMPHKKAIPANWCNQVIVHILGIMKGFVFLLPLGQIKQISKDEDKQWQDMDQLEYEVASDKKVKAGEEWSEAFAAPYATVEVFEAGEDEEIQPEAATHAHGRVNLPVGAGKRSEVTSISFSVITGLVGSDLLHDITSVTPGIFFEVAWAPVEGSDDKGTLTLTPIEAKGFPAPGASRRWKLRVGVHETMFGPSTRKCMSLGAAGAAEWDESVEFSVDWSKQQDGQAAKDQQAEQDLGTVKDRLDRQSIILEALEDVGRRASQASQGSKGAVRKKK